MLTSETLTELQNEPIPTLRQSTGWREVMIEENGENLVVLNNLDQDLVIVDPQYLNQKIPHALSLMYLRQSAATLKTNLCLRGFRLTFLVKNPQQIITKPFQISTQNKLFSETTEDYFSM